jgi:hemerythrin superfamily protein
LQKGSDFVFRRNGRAEIKGRFIMPLQHASTSQSRSGRTMKARATGRGRSKQQDAIKLLSADHDEVETLFKKFQKLRNGTRGGDLVRQICTALTVHAEIEEEIFYPAVRDALDQKDEQMMDEAAIEHQHIKELVQEIEDAGANDEMLRAKMKVLCEYVMHHVKEEEKNIFPKVKKTDLDLEELGAELQERKSELMEEQM